MSSLNILELIKKRTRYPMGNRIGDAWVDEILQRDDEKRTRLARETNIPMIMIVMILIIILSQAIMVK